MSSTQAFWNDGGESQGHTTDLQTTGGTFTQEGDRHSAKVLKANEEQSVKAKEDKTDSQVLKSVLGCVVIWNFPVSSREGTDVELY